MTKQLHLRAGFFLLLLAISAFPVFAQDPDIQDDRWDKIFRTSDLEGDTPTASRRYHGFTKRVGTPVGAVRLGCLCMDDTPSEVRSTGGAAATAGCVTGFTGQWPAIRCVSAPGETKPILPRSTRLK